MSSPLIYITTAYISGIIAAKIINFPILLSLLWLAFFLGSTVLGIISRNRVIFLILGLFILLGLLNFQIQNLPQHDDLGTYIDKGPQTLIGVVDEVPKIKGDSLSFPLKVNGIISSRAAKKAEGMVYVLLKANETSLGYGDQIKVCGKIKRFQNYSNPLMLNGKESYFFSASSCEKLGGGKGQVIKRTAIWFRARFNGILVKILPQKEAALLGSLLLGSSVSPLSEDLKNDYRKAGLIHLLVVSGTQVSILIGVCLSVTRAFNFPLWVAVLITSFFNFMLVIISGASPSILRAAIMGEITLIGLLFEKEKEFYTALALSALVLLLVNPLNLFDIGFQLSFAATWALVYIAPVLRDSLLSQIPMLKHEALRGTILNLLAISLAPILATMPIIAFYFSQISLGAIVSNLLVLPWVEFLVILGFSTLVLGFVFLPLAEVLGGAIWLMLVFLDWIAKFISSLPGACFYIRAPSLILIFGYYVGLMFLLERLRKEGRLKLTARRLAFASLLVISIFLWDQVACANVFGGRELAVTFLDVGQGDCILLEIPGAKKILIDGGGVEEKRETEGGGNQEIRDAIGEKVVVPFLRRKGINRLDLVILSHPHADHVGGLNRVLEEMSVDQVLDGGQVYESRAYKRFKALIEENKIKYSLARAGQVIHFGKDINGYILNPSDPLLENTNSDSIVMRLVYKDISFLFTGDLEKEGEEKVMQIFAESSLVSSILKAGHHGSATSTSAQFLTAVNPQVAVISCGRHNKFRHPHTSTLKKLGSSGVKIYRTDENGAVTIRTNGKTYAIETQK